mmetsp:Transcript_41656/g.126310  ORF Transcript_41656/g.126310 Transcript_41656/m.126310 type:complete len:384 (-) Transcript_41656:30-1181(-)
MGWEGEGVPSDPSGREGVSRDASTPSSSGYRRCCQARLRRRRTGLKNGSRRGRRYGGRRCPSQSARSRRWTPRCHHRPPRRGSWAPLFCLPRRPPEVPPAIRNAPFSTPERIRAILSSNPRWTSSPLTLSPKRPAPSFPVRSCEVRNGGRDTRSRGSDTARRARRGRRRRWNLRRRRRRRRRHCHRCSGGVSIGGSVDDRRRGAPSGRPSGPRRRRGARRPDRGWRKRRRTREHRRPRRSEGPRSRGTAAGGGSSPAGRGISSAPRKIRGGISSSPPQTPPSVPRRRRQTPRTSGRRWPSAGRRRRTWLRFLRFRFFFRRRQRGRRGQILPRGWGATRLSGAAEAAGSPSTRSRGKMIFRRIILLLLLLLFLLLLLLRRGGYC